MGAALSSVGCAVPLLFRACNADKIVDLENQLLAKEV